MSFFFGINRFFQTFFISLFMGAICFRISHVKEFFASLYLYPYFGKSYPPLKTGLPVVLVNKIPGHIQAF